MNGMRSRRWAMSAALMVIVVATGLAGALKAEQAASAQTPGTGVRITYPLEGTLFPPEIVAPTFVWEDPSPRVHRWNIVVRDAAGLELLRAAVDAPHWRAPEASWEQIKTKGLHSGVEVAVTGVDTNLRAVSSAQVHIQTSTDKVGDSIMYREVPLPFLKAVQDPSKIRWRFGSVDQQDGPPVVLKNLPVCGNCHSFADNGSTLGMDVDYGNDKGAYAIMPVSKHMVLDDAKIMTWDDYKREDGELTFGLLSKVSPTGRLVVSTVKDRSVFVATPDITFSQLFFPIKGILVVYDRETKKFSALPGADDPQYVQTNAVWSPDGKELVFARAKAYRSPVLEEKNAVIADNGDVPEFVVDHKPFRYDLYRIPYNDGKGGTPQPLEGAANNGMSNFFPKYSPDGKWIVFCKAKSYMLLQPDSELYIVPAAGGPARRLRYNTSRMNSWHSWSSNSRWLVFSSKVNTPYTQLFLTHIDENGNDSPPVLLERFTSSDRAANIPEFVNVPSDGIAEIKEQFLDPYSYLRAGMVNENTGDHKGAERIYRRGLEVAPNDADLHNALGWTLFQEGRSAEAVIEYERSLITHSGNAKAHNNLALALVDLGRLDDSVDHFRKSVEIQPKPEIYADLGATLARLGRQQEARTAYQKALELDPTSASANFNLAVMYTQAGALADAEACFRRALHSRANAETHNGLGYVLARQGRVGEAVAEFRLAIAADAKFTPAHRNLAEALAGQGKTEEANLELAKANAQSTAK